MSNPDFIEVHDDAVDAAFCREVIAGIDDDAARALCTTALDAALARLGA